VVGMNSDPCCTTAGIPPFLSCVALDRKPGLGRSPSVDGLLNVEVTSWGGVFTHMLLLLLSSAPSWVMTSTVDRGNPFSMSSAASRLSPNGVRMVSYKPACRR
jgi:hypothetical protein